VNDLPELPPPDAEYAAALRAADVCTVTASDGYRLHYRHWRTDGVPRGYVVCLHGIQSHSGWYGYSSEFLRRAGYDVRYLDRRGSGLNAADRGHAPHADRLVNDVTQFLADVRHERDRLGLRVPVVLSAVSWGGRLAAVVAKRRPELLDALALLDPGVYSRYRPNWLQRRLLHLATGFGATRRPVRLPMADPALFTDDPAWQDYIARDPLALREITTGLVQAGADLAAEAQINGPRISCPLLVMLAGRDCIVDNRSTRGWLSRLPADQSLCIEWPQAAHTLEFEPNRAEVFQVLLDGLEAL
jgi:alpha-beta hydrolase superfamily lysophospholipase